MLKGVSTAARGEPVGFVLISRSKYENLMESFKHTSSIAPTPDSEKTMPPNGGTVSDLVTKPNETAVEKKLVTQKYASLQQNTMENILEHLKVDSLAAAQQHRVKDIVSGLFLTNNRLSVDNATFALCIDGKQLVNPPVYISALLNSLQQWNKRLTPNEKLILSVVPQLPQRAIRNRQALQLLRPRGAGGGNLTDDENVQIGRGPSTAEESNIGDNKDDSDAPDTAPESQATNGWKQKRIISGPGGSKTPKALASKKSRQWITF